MNRTQLLAIAFVALLVVPGVALGNVKGNPELSLYAPENVLAPGTEMALDVMVSNVGTLNETDRTMPDAEGEVTTAKGLTLTLRSGSAPITVKSGTIPVGTVPEGVIGPSTFRIHVNKNATPGTYEVPIDVEYRYVREVQDDGEKIERHVEDTLNVSVVVERAPRFALETVNSSVDVGDTGDVTIELENVGQEPAENARIMVQSTDPQFTFGGVTRTESFVGNWPVGDTKTVTLEASLPLSADPRSYPLKTWVVYDDASGIETQTKSLTTAVDVGPHESRFEILRAETDVSIGDSGTVSVTVLNVGDELLNASRVSVQSTDPELTFGLGGATAANYVGEWAPGDAKTIDFPVAIASNADRRAYPVIATVAYLDEDDEVRQSEPVIGGLTPDPEVAFSLESLDSDLHVSEDGTIAGTVVNTGDTTVKNAVLRWRTESETLEPGERAYPLGTLEPEASSEFSFDVDVSSNARDGPRQLSFDVQYRDDRGDRRVSDELDVTRTVEKKRDEFAVETRDASVTRGTSTTIDLEMTNVRSEPFTDVTAKLFVKDPLSTSDDEAFVATIDPGETRIISFQIAASGSALTKNYPVEVDFEYTDADGDTSLSKTYAVPLSVTQPEEGQRDLVPIAVGAVVLLVVMGVGFIWYRRR